MRGLSSVRKRGSKVVETILEALKDGSEADIPALKSGLSTRLALSENSLSKQVSLFCKKDGRVKRNGDGVYALASLPRENASSP